MSYYLNEDDWIHVDDYNQEIDRLEEEVKDLKYAVDALEDNSLFTLTEMLLIRDRILKHDPIEDILTDLNILIRTFSEDEKARAISKINEMEFA
jgi:hypothetical protein